MDNSSYDKLINRILDKRYKIEDVVGVGGMAYVLKAKDLVSGKDVALKILNDELRSDERAVKRFINESKTVSMLDHENIVKILDVVINGERKYIVMEFIDGITLKDYIDNIGILGWKEAVHYTKQILSALSHAHEKQVIHRDIKPQNIMLLSDGTVKVTDFGIAKMPNTESITVTDKAIGTVNYISPEQASGGKIDFRTDIYSVGVMLYEMVSGRLPFIADSPVAVAMMQVSDEPIPPREINPQIPDGLEQIILKSMQKNPDERFISAAAMLNALQYFSENPDVVFAASSASAAAKKGKYEDPRKKKERMLKMARGSRSMFPIIAGIASSFAAVAVILAIVLVFPFFKDASGNSAIDKFVNGFTVMVDTVLGANEGANGDKELEVPSFVGEKYDDGLVDRMKTQGFAVKNIRYVKDPSYSANVVVKQDPEAGEIRFASKDGVGVILYINQGKESFEMPDCSLLSVNDAKKLIRNRVGAVSVNELPVSAIKVVEEYHDTYPADYVIKTDPEAKAVMTFSPDMQFTIYVSKGQKISNTTVPELEGKTLDEAKREIIASKLALGRIYYEESTTVGAGKVIKANHPKGETVAQNITSIDLWVSIGSDNPIYIPETPDTPENTQEDNTQSTETPDAAGDIEGLLNMREGS